MTAETLTNKVNRRKRSVLPLRLRKKYLSRSTINAIGNMLTKTSTSLHSTVHPTGDNLNYTLDYEYIPGTRKARRIGGMFYAYDADGNLIAEQAGSPPVTGVDGSDRVIRYHEGVFSVDYGFALTNRPPIDAGEGSNVFRRDFMWNDRGLLRRSVDRQFDVHYRYGHDGQRALKYSVSGSQHRETLYFNRMFTITQMATRDIESKHIFVGNTRIVTKRRQAGHYHVGHEQRMQYFYHGDHLGSVQLVTDWEGNIYEHLEYTPYGELWVDHSVRSVGAYPTVFRFTAHERDPETGFTYAGARYLDPRTSRWISADPAMWEGDFFPQAPINDEARRHNENLRGEGGIFNLVNMHVFHYGGNNPVKYVDPDGREVVIFSLFVTPTDRHLFIAVRTKDGTITTRGLYPESRLQAIRDSLPIIGGGTQPTRVISDKENELAIAQRHFAGEGLPIGSRYEATIGSHSGMPQEIFDKLVLRAADNYPLNDRPYNAIRGPNSNTFVSEVIESAGRKLPEIRNATQQDWRPPLE